jgi:hypothetical protein
MKVIGRLGYSWAKAFARLNIAVAAPATNARRPIGIEVPPMVVAQGLVAPLSPVTVAHSA